MVKEFEQLKKDLEDKNQQREENKKKFSDFYKKWKNEKYLFSIYEERYHKQEENLLNERKKKLLEIREAFRPHQLEDFKTHQEKYNEFKQKMIQDSRKSYSNSVTEVPAKNYYKS